MAMPMKQKFVVDGMDGSVLGKQTSGEKWVKLLFDLSTCISRLHPSTMKEDFERLFHIP